MNRFMITFSASLIACGVTTLGIFLVSKNVAWSKRNVAYFMSFASGILIAVSFLHLIPESLEMNSNAPLFMLAGYLFLLFFSRFLHLFLCQEDKCVHYATGIIPMIGIGLHSFIDGIIYSITFKVGVFTGVLAATGMVLHEFPEGILTFVFLSHAGFSKKKSFLLAFLAAAISTPLGTLVSYPFLEGLKGSFLGAFLAASSGTLLYVGATHLAPEVEKQNKRFTLLSLSAGVLTAIGIVFLSH